MLQLTYTPAVAPVFVPTPAQRTRRNRIARFTDENWHGRAASLCARGVGAREAAKKIAACNRAHDQAGFCVPYVYEARRDALAEAYDVGMATCPALTEYLWGAL